MPAGKRPPEDTKWRSSRASAPHKKDQSGSAADWRPPRSGDQEGDGRSGYPKTQRDETEQYVGTCDRDLEEGAQALWNFSVTQPVTGGGC